MKKTFIDVEKLIEAIKPYETEDKGVSALGILCSVEPKNGMRKFDDEYGFGKFLMPLDNLITEIDIPEERKKEEEK